MNIFLPYEDNIVESVRALDDKRLIKQVLECYQLLTNAISEKCGVEIKGYGNHPIYTHYKTNIPFLWYYGKECCKEYEYRFDKEHKLYSDFKWMEQSYDISFNGDYQPFYAEGSKGKPNFIRTTKDVSVLYQMKLLNKWQSDYENERFARWTKRGMPQFFMTIALGEIDNATPL